MLQIRPADLADAVALAPRLRAADRREIEAGLAKSADGVLRYGVLASDPCHAVVEDGTVLALFGVVPKASAPDVGVVWLLASEELAAHALSIVRSSKTWIARLQERFRVLTNFVDARNEVHIRWLQWCGFEFVRRVERFGAMGLPFYEVRRERETALAPGTLSGAGTDAKA
jgi:hypothetical protein